MNRQKYSASQESKKANKKQDLLEMQKCSNYVAALFTLADSMIQILEIRKHGRIKKRPRGGTRSRQIKLMQAESPNGISSTYILTPSRHRSRTANLVFIVKTRFRYFASGSADRIIWES